MGCVEYCSMLYLRTMGDLRLLDARGHSPGGGRKELVLLAYLSADAPRPIPRSDLAALLWGDRDEARARHSLRQALLRLRRLVGSGLEVTPRSARVGAGVVELDLTALEEDLAAGRLADAVERARGPFLPGLEDLGSEPFRQWVLEQRVGLQRRLEWALEELAVSAERRGAWEDMAAWAQRWSELEPFAERPQLLKIEALERAGRAADALAEHSRFVARLSGELGVSPSASFLESVERIERRGRLHPGLAPSPGSAALFTPDLIGRSEEMGDVEAAWRAARDGNPAVLILEGEPGMGKTRVCEELLRRVRAAGESHVLLRARGTAEGSWATVRDLLVPLRAAPGLSGAPDRALGELSQLLPSLRERFPDLPLPRGGDAVTAAALSRVLSDVAAECPILLLVDDLMAADADSRRLLLTLARQPPAAALLIVLTVERWETTPAFASLARAPAVRRVRLRPLAAADVDALLASMLACARSERAALAERLHAETGGNPLVITEIVSSLVEDGRLAPGADGYWHLFGLPEEGSLPLPASARDAIERRLARLDDAARRAMAAAARLGEPFSRPLLASCAGLTAEATAEAVDDLVARRLLRQAPARADALEFSHPLVRRVALEVDAIPDNATAPPPDSSATPRAVPPRWPMSGSVASVSHHPESTDLEPASRAARVVPPGPAFMVRPGAAGLALGAIVLLSIALVLFLGPLHSAAPAPVLAVGEIRATGPADTTSLVGSLPALLATNLARVAGLRVVSPSRLFEIAAKLDVGSSGPDSGLAEAARRADAGELLEGEVLRRPDGQLRLELRRVDLQSGRVSGGYEVEATDAFGLADAATHQIARELGRAPPRSPLMDVTTGSRVAYGFYEEGLRAYYQGDMRTAQRLLRAALREDTVFALAAYYAVVAEWSLGLPRDTALYGLLRRSARRLPEPERLLFRLRIAWSENDPRFSAFAESLALRYPDLPDAQLFLGLARIYRGDVTGALEPLRRAVALDSAGISGRSPRCVSCDALGTLAGAYGLIDSLTAGEQVARGWVRRQPGSASAWFTLAENLALQGRDDEAAAAMRRGGEIAPLNPYPPVYPAIVDIRAGRFEAADRLLVEVARGARPDLRTNALWFYVISLRYQGRLREALRAAREMESIQPNPYLARLAEAQVLLEMGRRREAAERFAALSDSALGWAMPTQGMLGSIRSHMLTHVAVARAAAGDTAGLAELADSIQAKGARTYKAGRRQLHHHVRALLLEARGDYPGAERELRLGVASPPWAYEPTYYELGRVLLSEGRPQEAIAEVRPMLFGTLEGSRFYLTHTQLHELLGQAWEEAGRPDSAAVHYRWVVAALRRCDPELRPVRAHAEAALSRLSGHEPARAGQGSAEPER